MQDKYVGDIGDFANNGLLRALCGTWEEPVAGMRLGVVWYFNKSSGPDGNHIGYLNTSNSNNSLHRRCDKKLYDKFQELVGNSLISKKERCISQIESGRILPPDTQYFGDQVPVGDRKNWLSNALEKTDQAKIVFINPDKGLAPESINPTQKASCEYVFMDDLKAFAERPQSLVIYHHLGQRNKVAQETINSIATLMEQELDRSVLALRWHRVQGRAYFIIEHPSHQTEIRDKIRALLESPWGQPRRGMDQPCSFTQAYPPEEL